MDVVVTDLKMPEMDGSQLLREIKTRHPHVVRIACQSPPSVKWIST